MHQVPASQETWGSPEHHWVDPMLLLIGNLRPRMGRDLPKVPRQSGAESKPLMLSQAWFLPDSRASLEKETQLRQREAGSPAFGALFSGCGIVPTDTSMWTALNIQCVCTEALVSPLAKAYLDPPVHLSKWHLPPRRSVFFAVRSQSLSLCSGEFLHFKRNFLSL